MKLRLIAKDEEYLREHWSEDSFVYHSVADRADLLAANKKLADALRELMSTYHAVAKPNDSWVEWHVAKETLAECEVTP